MFDAIVNIGGHSTVTGDINCPGVSSDTRSTYCTFRVLYLFAFINRPPTPMKLDGGCSIFELIIDPQNEITISGYLRLRRWKSVSLIMLCCPTDFGVLAITYTYCDFRRMDAAAFRSHLSDFHLYVSPLPDPTAAAAQL